MKLILGVSLLFSLNLALAKSTSLECMSETSTLKINNKEVLIKHRNLPQNEILRKVIADKSGLRGMVSPEMIEISEVMIKLPAKHMNCVSSGFNLFDCSGNSKKATVSITGTYKSSFASGMISFSRSPSKVNLASVKTSLASSGAVVLGDGPITIELEKLNAQTEVDLEIDNQIVPVDMGLSFKKSECK